MATMDYEQENGRYDGMYARFTPAHSHMSLLVFTHRIMSLNVTQTSLAMSSAIEAPRHVQPSARTTTLPSAKTATVEDVIGVHRPTAASIPGTSTTVTT